MATVIYIIQLCNSAQPAAVSVGTLQICTVGAGYGDPAGHQEDVPGPGGRVREGQDHTLQGQGQGPRVLMIDTNFAFFF